MQDGEGSWGRLPGWPSPTLQANQGGVLAARLNDTLVKLTARAKRAHKPVAAFAREVLEQALAEREANERRAKLAADYVASREDDRELMAEMESAQLELMG